MKVNTVYDKKQFPPPQKIAQHTEHIQPSNHDFPNTRILQPWKRKTK